MVERSSWTRRPAQFTPLKITQQAVLRWLEQRFVYTGLSYISDVTYTVTEKGCTYYFWLMDGPRMYFGTTITHRAVLISYADPDLYKKLEKLTNDPLANDREEHRDNVRPGA